MAAAQIEYDHVEDGVLAAQPADSRRGKVFVAIGGAMLLAMALAGSFAAGEMHAKHLDDIYVNDTGIKMLGCGGPGIGNPTSCAGGECCIGKNTHALCISPPDHCCSNSKGEPFVCAKGMYCAGDICHIGSGGQDYWRDSGSRLPPDQITPPPTLKLNDETPAPTSPTPSTTEDFGSAESTTSGSAFKTVTTTGAPPSPGPASPSPTPSPTSFGSSGNNAFCVKNPNDPDCKKIVDDTKTTTATPEVVASSAGGWQWWQVLLLILAIVVVVPALVVAIGSQTCPEQVAPCLALIGAGKPKSKRTVTTDGSTDDDNE